MKNVLIDAEMLTVVLDDGRVISVPLTWYPRLWHGTPEERANFRLIGGGEGIRWPDLDEDISAEDLLAGRRSGEGKASLMRWLRRRR
nr:DUF2442 domain-containing protein [Thermanaerothrix sp.]